MQYFCRVGNVLETRISSSRIPALSGLLLLEVVGLPVPGPGHWGQGRKPIRGKQRHGEMLLGGPTGTRRETLPLQVDMVPGLSTRVP